MYWQEHDRDNEKVIPDDIQDLSFRLEAKTLPLDHAYALSAAIKEKLPWLCDETCCAIHLINYPASGSGWNRPEDSISEIVHLSGRTRLTLRLPKHRLEDAGKLTGQLLDIDGHKITVGKATPKLLVNSASLFSRRVVVDSRESEENFVKQIVSKLEEINIDVRKILCGRIGTLQFPSEIISVRSVMIADLGFAESIKLQQIGLGPERLTGCGIFIPHKSIASTNDRS